MRQPTSFLIILSLVFISLTGFATDLPKQFTIRQDRFFGGPYGVTGNPYLIRGEVVSIGNEVFQSVFLKYQVNNEPVRTTFFQNLGLNPYIPFRYLAEEHWTPENTGEFELRIWFTGLNGAHENQGFSDTIKKTIGIYEYLPKRQLALLESFSSINCGSCATVAPVLRQMVEKELEHYALIYYHPLSYEGSPLFQFNPHDQTIRKELYNITYTPVSAIGTTFFGGSFEVTPDLMDFEREKYSAFGLQGSYTIQENLLNVNIDLESFAAFAENAGNTLLLAVVENHVQFDTPPGSNGEKDFYYVMRSFLPNANGTALSGIKTGNRQTFSFQYDLNDLPSDQDKLTVLAFVQDLESLEIHQAVRLSIETTDPTSAGRIDSEQINAYPNPTTGMLKISPSQGQALEAISIFNLSGSLVKRIFPGAENQQYLIDLSHLPQGVYLLQVFAGSKAYMQKIYLIKP